MNRTFLHAGLGAALLALACQPASAHGDPGPRENSIVPATDAGELRTTDVMRLADNGNAPAGYDNTSGTVSAGDLTITGAFARATPPNAPVGGGYLAITNNGSEDDRLIAARSPAAPDVQMHEMAVVDDVMQMRRLADGVPLPAGETVTFEPGGLHLMFMQIPEPFEQGTTIPVTLTFERAGEVKVVLEVRGMGAGAGSHGDGGSMDMEDGTTK